MYNECEDTTKPAVDETAIECCGQYASDCVFLSKEFSYLELEKGDSLTETLEVIEEKLQNIETNPLPFRDYSNVITQVSTSDPTGLTAISTFPTTVTITFTRAAVGIYEIAFSAAVLDPSTVVFMPSNKPTLFSVEPEVVNSSLITVRTYNPSGVLADGLLNNTPILIRATNV